MDTILQHRDVWILGRSTVFLAASCLFVPLRASGLSFSSSACVRQCVGSIAHLERPCVVELCPSIVRADDGTERGRQIEREGARVMQHRMSLCCAVARARSRQRRCPRTAGPDVVGHMAQWCRAQTARRAVRHDMATWSFPQVTLLLLFALTRKYAQWMQLKRVKSKWTSCVYVLTSVVQPCLTASNSPDSIVSEEPVV